MKNDKVKAVEAIKKIQEKDLLFFPTKFKNKYLSIDNFRSHITFMCDKLLREASDESKDEQFLIHAYDFIKIVSEAYSSIKYESKESEKCGLELYTYQRKMINFIEHVKNVILSVGMGLGKTAAVLHYIDSEIKKNYKYRVLIIAPKRVAETVWMQEAEKWHLTDVCEKMVRCIGDKEKRLDGLITASKSIKITSRDNINDVLTTFGCDEVFDLVVLDELTSYKNMLSKRTEAVSKIKAKKFIGLTGTFIPNGEIDIFGQAVAVPIYEYNIKKFYVWRTFNFENVLENANVNFQKWKLTAPIGKVLAPLKENIFSLASEDYLDIPAVVEHRKLVSLTEEEYRHYISLVATLHFTISDINIAVRENAKLAKLQQLCNDFIYKKDKMTIRGGNLTKLNEVCQCIEDCHEEAEKVLLFYSYVEELKVIEEFCDSKNITYATPDERGFVEKWNNGEVDCLIAHPASAGHGLNLQFGGRVIIWSTLTYNYEYFAQANARLARTGQKQCVNIYYFVTKGTVEEHILEKLKAKEKENQKIVNLTK